MRIKISTILRVLVYIAILVNIHFAYFLNIPLVPPFVATNFIIVCSLLLLSTIKNNGIYAASCKKITPFIAVGTLCFAVETIYSMIRFSQSVGEVWSSSKYFMQLLMVYSIVYILSTEKKDIMCDMACITSFGLMLRLIYAVLYNTYNITVFPLLIEDVLPNSRNGLIRMSATSLASISTIYLFYYISCTRKARIYHYVFFITDLLTYIYVSQSRVNMVIIFVTILVMYVAKEKRGKRELIIAGALLVFCFIFATTDYVQNFMWSFSEKSEYGGSTTARLAAIEYYWNCPYRNKLFGMGFINTDNNIERYLIVHRTTGSMQAFYSDIGLLGLYFNIGLFGIALYAYFLCRLLKAVKIGLSRDKSYERIVIFGFATYYILSSVTLIMLMGTTIFAIPFIWGYLEIYINTRDNRICMSENDRT